MDKSSALDERHDSEDEGRISRKCTTLCDRCLGMCSKMVKCLDNEEEAARLAGEASKDQSFARQSYRHGDTFKLDSGSRELKASACEICRAIGIAVSGEIGDWTREMESPSIEWYRSYGVFRFDYSHRGMGSSLHLLAPSSFQTLPPLSHLELVRNWIKDCSNSHDCCSLEQQESLLDLRVIDCIQRIVVPAPGKCHYVALSYVWGKVGNMPLQENCGLETGLPATIEDSITVTLLLGYRYLWVDKYCVQQHDSRDKHIQIQQMDLIYASAQITLIGAAGEDCTCGLPGVGRKRNFPYVDIDLGSATFRFEFESSSVTTLIRHSTWSTRAWTLQEGYLSRRRLYFTDHEILFVCNRTVRHEFNSSSDKVYLHHLESTFPISHEKDASALRKAMGVLEQYSNRSLSFQSDALNAVLGILKSFRSEPDPVGSIWGVPFGNYATAEKTPNPRFCLYWRNAESSTRRHGFPSWSPLGWEGTKWFHPFQHPISAPSIWDLWEPCDRQYSTVTTIGVSHELLMSAYILRLFVVYNGEDRIPGIVLPTPDDTWSVLQWDDSDAENEEWKSVLCAVTFSRESWGRSNYTVYSIIILEARGEKYERKGLSQLTVKNDGKTPENWFEDRVKQTIILV